MLRNHLVCWRSHNTLFDLQGVVRQYINAVTEHWLLTAPLANPAMLDMFRDRDYPPQRQLVPWAGEFAGKYLTSAVQVLRTTNNPKLRSFIGEFVQRLLDLQDVDGYLGPWTKTNRLTNFDPLQEDGGMVTWDTWGHYHIMLGLLLWYEESGDPRVLHAVERIGDLLCDIYLRAPEKRLVDTGMTEMNLAPVHSLCLLYRKTGIQRYLDLALQIVDEFAAASQDGPLAGDYVNQALAGFEFYEMPKPRWESLHPIMALAELYSITGDERYRQAFEQIWWSIVKFDRHNTGGFSSGEKASGDPFDRGPIETCCTIAWIALSVEMLKLTGNSIVADEIELSSLNTVIGMHSPTGRWATYNTPMDGVRRASAHSIVFQAREGSPELNCCSVNSPRGFGMLSDWAVMEDEEGVILNYYGPSSMQLNILEDITVKLHQETDYPISGNIKIHFTPMKNKEFSLKLRIPYWSEKTKLLLNNQEISGVTPGQYYVIRRIWQEGDFIDLNLDMTLHYWAGERACDGLTSIYRGPILLTYDHRYNLHLTEGQPPSVREIDEWHAENYFLIDMPLLDAEKMIGHHIKWDDWLSPWLLFEYESIDGQVVRFCDFGSAGVTGTPYRSWMLTENAPEAVEFSRENPLRSTR
jgi:DUF1680 family protein